MVSMYDRTLRYHPRRLALQAVALPARLEMVRSYLAGSPPAREVQAIGQAIDADLCCVPLPGVSVESGRIGGVSLAFVGSKDAVIFVQAMSGLACHLPDGRYWTLGGGEMLIAPASARPKISFAQAGGLCAVYVDRRRLQAALPGADLSQVQHLAATAAGVEMLVRYAQALGGEAPMPVNLLALAAGQVIDLAANVVASNDVRGHLSALDGPKAARLAAIENDILEHFRSPGLSIAGLAAGHAISPRYIQMLFEESGTTFTAFLHRTRLEFARKRLGDDDLARIADIAFESGFSDLSTFNRLFRRHFGVSPTVLRAGGGIGPSSP